MSKYRVLPAGDTALVVEFGETIDRQLNNQVLALARHLNERRVYGILETVPTFRSLMIYYDPLVLPAAALTAHIDELLRDLRPSDQAGRQWHLPVCYDTSLAPDLEDVAARTGLSAEQVIERHSAVTYHVYMLGFLPGQAYLGDLPAELVLPRRESPRLKIPAGSLAIATQMTCIFPLETPCGWHLIGRSPIALWEMSPDPRALLAPGDTVTFKPISIRDYEDLQAKVAAGDFSIVPDEEAVGAAA